MDIGVVKAITPNDGGIVLTLFLAIAAISYAMFSAVAYYSAILHSPERKELRLLRLLSGVANLSNGVIHAVFVMLLYSHSDKPELLSDYKARTFYTHELEEGLGGPIALMVINSLVGLYSLNGGGPKVSAFWNTFVVFAGTLIPLVWLRFIETGLTQWPYIVVFIWFAIFAMELTSATCSITWYFLKGVK